MIMARLVARSTKFDTRLKDPNGAASVINTNLVGNANRRHHAEFYQLILQVGIGVELLSLDCNLSQTDVIRGYLRETFDGEDPRRVPVGDALGSRTRGQRAV